LTGYKSAIQWLNS